MDTITNTPAMIIDQHRITGGTVGSRARTIECACGHESIFYYSDITDPISEEYSPRRIAERYHAQHVAKMLTA